MLLYAGAGTGRYQPDGDLTAAGYHMGLFDEDTPLPIKLYVHVVESGSEFFARSFYRGVESDYVFRSGDAIIVSPSSDPPPACMTDPAYVYAVVHGHATDEAVHVDDSLSKYFFRSDVAIAAMFQGIVVPGQSKIVRIDYTTTSGIHSNATQNGVRAEDDLFPGNEGFTITEDDSCAFPFRPLGSAATVPPATTCENDCFAVSGFDLDPPVGTAFQLTIMGTISWDVIGSGVYHADCDWRPLAVHSGVVRHGEVKTIWAFYMGWRDAFYHSNAHNVFSALFTSDYAGAFAVTFSTTNTPPPLSPDITMVRVAAPEFGERPYGASYYRYDTNLNAAAQHAGLVNSLSGPRVLYVHTYLNPFNEQWPYYFSSTYAPFDGAFTTGTSDKSAFRITAAAAPIPSPPSVTSNEVELRCSLWSGYLEILHGHGFAPRDDDLCANDNHHGVLVPGMSSLNVWVH
jgi:hypothetical protein